VREIGSRLPAEQKCRIGERRFLLFCVKHMRKLVLVSAWCSITALAAAFYSPFSATPRAQLASPQAGSPALPVGLPVYRVTNFGALPNDGKDDYDAMQLAANAVCGTGGTLIYPPGVYQINRVKVMGGPNQNGVGDILYRHCDNVLISGRGAIIRIKGNFSRTADYATGRFFRSYNNGVVPFHFEESSNFTVEGFELHGGVDQMVRDPGVVEAGNAGISTFHCRHYTLRDLNIHHFHTDGIYIGGSRQPDEDVLIERVSAHNNARLALAVIQARNVLVRDSNFSSSGRTGKYGYHAPGMGVDVEPNYLTSPPTENVRFEHCAFKDNIGGSFDAAHPDKTGTVTVTNCDLASPDDSVSVNVFIVTDPGEISNNTFTVPAGHRIFLTYTSISAKILYTGNTFNLARTDGIMADKNPGYNVSFTRNRINIASIHGLLLLRNLGVVQGNEITIGGAPAGSSASPQSLVSYEGTMTVGENNLKIMPVAK